MKLTNSTLKQYIKQILAEQKLLTEVYAPGNKCTPDDDSPSGDSDCIYGEKCVDGKCVPIGGKDEVKNIKWGMKACAKKEHKEASWCTKAVQRHMRLRLSKLLYPMKLAKDPQRQKKERLEINAACFGWKRKPAKEGDLGKPNRIFGKVYRDAKKSKKCPEPSKMPFVDWKMARRCNWRGNSECVQKILNRFSKCTYSKNWVEGFRPTGWGTDPAKTRLVIRGCKQPAAGKTPRTTPLTGDMPHQVHDIANPMTAGTMGTGTATIYCSDVLCAAAAGETGAKGAKGAAGETGAATAAGPCGKGTTPAAQLRQAAQHLHDDMQGPGSGNTVKTMIRHQKDLTALSAAFDLVTTDWEKKKWGDLAQWLSDESGCGLCQKWGQKVRQCAPVPKWCTVCGGQTPPKQGAEGERTASTKEPKEPRAFGPVSKEMGFAVTESKTFSSFPGQQKLTEGWKKYLDTE
jgi:hypothetical protein